jgi:hypothetical protein
MDGADRNGVLQLPPQSLNLNPPPLSALIPASV